MDETIQKAKKDGNWQHLYALLRRAERDDEAEDLFLNHPITVECTIQYVYILNWRDTAHYVSESIRSHTWEGLLDEFIAHNVGASLITCMDRVPTYHVLGTTLNISTWAIPNQPLKKIALSQQEINEFKTQAKLHPYYLAGATPEQLADVAEADARDAREMARKIEEEERQLEARVRREHIQSVFEAQSEQQRRDGWELWTQHHTKSRAEFAQSIQHFSVTHPLFKMWEEYQDKSMAATGKGAWAKWLDLWTKARLSRWARWKKHNLVNGHLRQT